MKRVQTDTYISVLKELVEEGKEVSVLITGSSMAPFLIHERDRVCFRKPERKLKKGDMVFYQRNNGQFVVHRILRTGPKGYYMAGDAQSVLEGPIEEGRIFALVTEVIRKGRRIKPGNPIWEFFERVWPCMLSVRESLIKWYGRFCRRKMHCKITGLVTKKDC